MRHLKAADKQHRTGYKCKQTRERRRGKILTRSKRAKVKVKQLTDVDF